MIEYSKIKFAIAGCGHIGKRHAAEITANRECELVAICDTVDKEQHALENNSIPFYHSVDDLLGSGITFDVLVIATPNGLHEEHAIKTVKARHHALIEKPMALTAESCERMIAEAEKNERQLFCVMQNRYAAPVLWLKDILSRKILGEIFIVQVNCFWNRDERYYTGNSWHGTAQDGGVLFTQFSHFIDMILYCFGEITNISSRMNNFNHQSYHSFPDSGIISFDLVSGGMGSINFSTSLWEQNMESSITIIASNGTIKIGGQYMDTVEYCNIKDLAMPVLQKPTRSTHALVIENVVDVLKGRSVKAIHPEEALKTVEIIERIYSMQAETINF